MADEGRFTFSIAMANPDNNQALFETIQRQFQYDISEAQGPTPGLVQVTASGVDIDLSLLTSYGICIIENLEADPGDESKTVDYGIKDGSSFYPLGAVRPTEAWPFRLSPNLLEQWGATGTGTAGPTDQTFHMRSMLTQADIIVRAYQN